MSLGFYEALVSVVMSSYGRDMSVKVVVANSIHHGSDSCTEDSRFSFYDHVHTTGLVPTSWSYE